MPEGDTIARLAAKISDRFVGETVTASIFRHPRLATVDLTGSVLESTESHGKHLFLHWNDERSLHVHLLMQGRIRFGVDTTAEEWRRRFELDFGDSRLTGVDVPLLHLVSRARVPGLVSHLGPDLCGRYEPDLAVARLSADIGRPLGGALLDQRNVAGFGNIYAVEVPFICGVSPYRPIETIDGLDSLLAVGAALIRTNAHHGPQNTTGRRLEESDHHILSARTRFCPLCGTRLDRRSAERSPWNRRTVRCPSCQRDENTAVDVDRARTLLGLHPARRLLTFDDDVVIYSGGREPITVNRRGRHRPSFL